MEPNEKIDVLRFEQPALIQGDQQAYAAAELLYAHLDLGGRRGNHPPRDAIEHSIGQIANNQVFYALTRQGSDPKMIAVAQVQDWHTNKTTLINRLAVDFFERKKRYASALILYIAHATMEEHPDGDYAVQAYPSDRHSRLLFASLKFKEMGGHVYARAEDILDKNPDIKKIWE